MKKLLSLLLLALGLLLLLGIQPAMTTVSGYGEALYLNAAASVMAWGVYKERLKIKGAGCGVGMVWCSTIDKPEA